MKRNPKQSKDVAYLRQLCCSGLPKEIIVPELLRAMETVIPSSNNVFSGFDKQLNFAYFMLGFPLGNIEETTTIVINFFNHERMLRTQAWLAHHPIIPDFRVYDDAFFQGDLYHSVFSQLDQHFVIGTPIVRFGKMLGILNLFRSRQQKPFNRQDEELFLRLTPYVAHAFSAPEDKDILFDENGATGMMVLDQGGRIIYLSDSANYLLNLAIYPLAELKKCNEIALLEKLKQLCRNLKTIYHGRPAAPPTLCHLNARGRFIFCAYWLNRQNPPLDGLIGITIEHQEPQAIKVLRALQFAPLSPMQKQVAALLANNVSYGQACAKLHIKLTTLKDHIRNIYQRLDIHKHEELLPKLLEMNNQQE